MLYVSLYLSSAITAKVLEMLIVSDYYSHLGIYYLHFATALY